jgi:hypothetical protein
VDRFIGAHGGGSFLLFVRASRVGCGFADIRSHPVDLRLSQQVTEATAVAPREADATYEVGVIGICALCGAFRSFVAV